MPRRSVAKPIRKAMGVHVIGPRLRWLGWAATAVMAATVLAMLATF
ncbi:MAG TPA: hypothetical protein VFG38_08075 [Pseudomonadales bacterium]|nr:hypothetical protein [Pseudomonadales bacterium]